MKNRSSSWADPTFTTLHPTYYTEQGCRVTTLDETHKLTGKVTHRHITLEGSLLKPIIPDFIEEYINVE